MGASWSLLDRRLAEVLVGAVVAAGDRVEPEAVLGRRVERVAVAARPAVAVAQVDDDRGAVDGALDGGPGGVRRVDLDDLGAGLARRPRPPRRPAPGTRSVMPPAGPTISATLGTRAPPPTGATAPVRAEQRDDAARRTSRARRDPAIRLLADESAGRRWTVAYDSTAASLSRRASAARSAGALHRFAVRRAPSVRRLAPSDPRARPAYHRAMADADPRAPRTPTASPARRARTCSSTPTTRSTGIPWGAEALARAALLDRPIFLSIGYAACHWCHVMERESFEDEATAALPERRTSSRSRSTARSGRTSTSSTWAPSRR